MKIEELKAKYDTKKVNEIETEIDQSRELSTMAEKEFIFALAYLERTNRFKENPRFKASTFSDYIHDRFALTWQRYHGLRLAYVKFQHETETYGPGKVVQAIKQTGIAGAEKVFKEARKMEEKKGSPVKQETISNLIVKHRPQREDYKQKAEDVKEKAAETQKEAMALASELETKDEQIEKLKATVKRLQAENAVLLAENRKLKDRLQMVQGIDEFIRAYPVTPGAQVAAMA